MFIVADLITLRDKNKSFNKDFDLQSLKLQNGQVLTYCINLCKIIHQIEKG